MKLKHTQSLIVSAHLQYGVSSSSIHNELGKVPSALCNLAISTTWIFSHEDPTQSSDQVPLCTLTISRGWGLGDDGNSILHDRLVSILGMLTSICGRMECPSGNSENQMESPSRGIFQVFLFFSRRRIIESILIPHVPFT